MCIVYVLLNNKTWEKRLNCCHWISFRHLLKKWLLFYCSHFNCLLMVTQNKSMSLFRFLFFTFFNMCALHLAHIFCLCNHCLSSFLFRGILVVVVSIVAMHLCFFSFISVDNVKPITFNRFVIIMLDKPLYNKFLHFLVFGFSYLCCVPFLIILHSI